MKVKAKIFSCYKLTYTPIVNDVARKIYGRDFDVSQIELEIVDISNEGQFSIQSQRSIKKHVTRTIRFYENDRLVHIVGLSNTNYDLDKKNEFDLGLNHKNSFGKHNYHGNSYLKQGTPDIFNFYFDNKDNGVNLCFYLLDVNHTYPHNLFNVLSYRELETIGFKILNIDEIDFTQYEEQCRSKLNKDNVSFSSINKYMRDIAYVSRRNAGNVPSYLQYEEYSSQNEDKDEVYHTEKYIYTFKALSAQGYDSLFRCWCMKVLADKEGILIEFRLGKQYFSYESSIKRVSETLTGPIIETFQKANIEIFYVSDETFMNEKKIADTVYLRYKQDNRLRNQTLFRNNIRRKGIPIECVVCENDNSDILDAAHLWEINQIRGASKREIDYFITHNNLHYLIDPTSVYKNESFFKKYTLANSGDNGVWLCKNHHGLFDKNYFTFNTCDGTIIVHFDSFDELEEYTLGLSGKIELAEPVLTKATKAFIDERNKSFDNE